MDPAIHLLHSPPTNFDEPVNVINGDAFAGVYAMAKDFILKASRRDEHIKLQGKVCHSLHDKKKKIPEKPES